MHKTTYLRHITILENIENNLYKILKVQTQHSTKQYIQDVIKTLGKIKNGFDIDLSREALKQLRINERSLLTIINEFKNIDHFVDIRELSKKEKK